MKKLLLFSLVISGFTAQAQFWTQKATGFATASRGIDDISIVDPNVVWVKAYDGTAAAVPTIKDVAVSTDGGNTWTPRTFGGFGTGTLAMSSIHGVSATKAYLSAYGTSSTPGGVYVTVDGGVSWNKQTTAAYSAASFPNLVYFFDANNGVSMGDPESGYFEIYTTSNGGTNWTRVPSANIPVPLSTSEYGYVHNMDAVGSTLWFGTSLGRLYKTTDMGMTWTVSQSPLSDFGGTASSGNYSFSDANKGILNSAAGGLWNTTDGGVTWNPMTPTGTYGNNDIEYIPGTTRVVSTGGTPAYGSSYSLDDGMTRQTAQATTQFTTLEFLDLNTGFAGGFNTSSTAGGIYKYTGTELPTAHFEAGKFSVSPNPTNGMVQISGAAVNQVMVSDILGKKVFDGKYSSVENISVDLSGLHNGMYMMNITGENGSMKTIKVVKN